jgi:hypothetical protein
LYESYKSFISFGVIYKTAVGLKAKVGGLFSKTAAEISNK